MKLLEIFYQDRSKKHKGCGLVQYKGLNYLKKLNNIRPKNHITSVKLVRPIQFLREKNIF